MPNKMATMQGCCCEVVEFDDCQEIENVLLECEAEIDVSDSATFPNACCTFIETPVMTGVGAPGLGDVVLWSYLDPDPNGSCPGTGDDLLYSVQTICTAGTRKLQIVVAITVFNLPSGGYDVGRWTSIFDWDDLNGLVGESFTLAWAFNDPAGFCRITNTPTVTVTFHGP